MTPDHDTDVFTVAFLVLACVLALGLFSALAGCHDLAPAVTAANTQRAIGYESAAVLHDVCTTGYERAQTVEQVEALDDLGCPQAARALRALRTSHAVLVSTLVAFDAGRCTSLVNQAPRECNLTGSVLDVARAASELALAVEQIRGAR